MRAPAHVRIRACWRSRGAGVVATSRPADNALERSDRRSRVRRVGKEPRRELRHGVRVLQPEPGRAPARARLARTTTSNPGGPDRGQPTYFYPRRNRFHFKVRVPADFGKKELVWTLTTQGQTEKAYATLIPEYIIDTQLAMLDVGNFGRDPEGRDLLNKAPTVQLEGPAERRVAVGSRSA